MLQKYHNQNQIPDEDLMPFVNMHLAGRSCREIGEALDCGHATANRRVQLAARRGLLGTAPVLPGFRVSQITTTPKGDYVQQKPELGEEFQVTEGEIIKNRSVLVDGQGYIINQWIKTAEDKQRTIEMMQAALEAYKSELPRAEPVPAPAMTNSLLANQYTITDLHTGMLAWEEENRDSNYDIKIAEKLLRDWFSAAISCSPNAHTAILAQLGDHMHHDSHESVTPAHRNVLDADSRLQKVIRVVIHTIRHIIDQLLQKHQHVHIIWADANHDPASAAWMRELLFAFFDHEPRITVDRSADKYYAYEWGRVALFYHHGHRRKINDVDSVFAGKFREIYGRAKHSYGHIGHLHTDALKQSNLMKVERHRTLAPADAFSSSGGWITGRDAKVITYHKEYGEVARFTLSPEMVTDNA